ncbi:MAG: CobD/CbiB family protein [Burkholderiaceae bacterium]
MGFVALIFALLIEQGRPLPARNRITVGIEAYADAVRRGTDAGRGGHGVFGWCLIVGSLLAVLLLVQWGLSRIHPLALFCLYVAVLYWSVGFRQFSHAFTEIQLMLAAGDVGGARAVAQAWLGRHDPNLVVGDVPVHEICRLAIAHALVATHRHVFGPLFWFILPLGAVGPVLYRVAQLLADRWGGADDAYGEFARRAYFVLDWLPLRLSAAGFAVVGNFEDAVYCWRGAVAAGTGDDQRALLLATGGGALGLRLADAELEARWATGGQGFDWQGPDPGAEGLRSAVGLVWRSVILWIALFAMLTVANWLGQ